MGLNTENLFDFQTYFCIGESSECSRNIYRAIPYIVNFIEILGGSPGSSGVDPYPRASNSVSDGFWEYFLGVS